jgi:hypothetical protein
MRLDLAIDVSKGDTLYNCFMQPLVVADVEINRCNDGHINNINFVVVNTGLQSAVYNYSNLYFGDLEDEDDAEKAWINWAKNNKDFFDTFDHIETIKEIYRVGFYDGFEHRKYTNYLAEMQK